MKIILEVPDCQHLPPKYHAYEGGFTNLNQCVDCKLLGLYEDIHEVDPCPECGGKVWNTKPGKWEDGKWLLRTGVEKEPEFYKKKPDTSFLDFM